MNKKYELNEIYKTASGEYTFQEQIRTEESVLKEKMAEYMENGEKRLLAVRGLPGCGKSYLMKKVVGELNKDKRWDSVFVVYLDISDCADEEEVYYKIALQLNDYYNTHSDSNSKSVKEVEILIRLYEWVKGIRRDNFSIERKVSKSVADDIVDFISEKLKIFDLSNSSEDNKKDIYYNILLGLFKAVPFTKDIKWIVDTALNIKDFKEDSRFKKWLLEKIDVLDNKVMRQNFFLSELIVALSGVSRRMIVLDNFQMDPNKELGRDHTWLTTNGKMLNKIDAFWIIVSRMPTEELFLPIFEKYEDMELPGFTRDMAKRYLVENCFKCKNEYDYIQVMNDIANEKLVGKMLEVCDLNEKDMDETKRIYLPYLLRLVVLYYWNLSEDRTVTITPELFNKLNNQDDFVGFYFYKDLSDLMVNAFQILSCLSTWDSDWIQKVREKFDNHLLNARNLLKHKAPIEELGEKSFKLHEALRDGLYKNGQNYIKKDVLKHLFESFVNIYSNPKLSLMDRKIWYEQKKIDIFIEVVFEYINLEDERENRKENLEHIRPAMDNIYTANSKRGSVSDKFIIIYCSYIDKLAEVMGITFVKMHNNTFDSEEIFINGKCFVDNEEKQRQLLYYMECCFKLADLYTNISKNGIAWGLEKLCVSFWKCQMEQIKLEEMEYQNQVWYYRCWQQKIKALNSTAYDHSAEHKYKEAYMLGKKGLVSARELGRALLDKIELDSKEKDTMFMILDPDQNIEFSVDRAYTEIPHELHKKMKHAYKNLWVKKRSDTDSFVKILYDLMVTDYQKLRGNYPWYCINNPELMEKDEIIERERRKKVCEYGVRTYWMRRALSEAIKDTYLQKNMLTSYHNICVYLSKCGEYEKACFLEKEVLDETLLIIKPEEPNERSKKFIEKISSFDKNDLQKKLWESEGLNSSSGELFFSKSGAAFERMQYLGDFYLKMGYFTLAQRWLSKVMLMRSVVYGAMDGKTLDTVIRFYVTLYANQDKEDKEENEKTLLASLKEYVEVKIFRDTEENEWRSAQVAEGLWDKIKLMKDIMDIGHEGIKTKKQWEAVKKMVLRLDL